VDYGGVPNVLAALLGQVMSNAGYEISVAPVGVSSRETVEKLVPKATAIGEVGGVLHAADVSSSQASPRVAV
jgi:hypothetical protein